MGTIRHLFNFLFIFDGSSATRKNMWHFSIPYTISVAILAPHRDQLEILVLILIFAYSYVVVSVKRWKDRGRAPVWVILNFIPILQIWAGIELLFLPSKELSH